MVRGCPMFGRKMLNPAGTRVAASRTGPADKLERHVLGMVDVRGEENADVTVLFPRILERGAAISQINGVVRYLVDKAAAERPMFGPFLLEFDTVRRVPNQFHGKAARLKHIPGERR